METILVVDDDHAVQKALRRIFEEAGYNVEVCGDGQSALEMFRTAAPAAIILDLGLPAMSGADVCQQIKHESCSLPVIVLTAKTSESDKIVLLELGADDYLTKPFSPRELLARVKAKMRRAQKDALTCIKHVEFGGAIVDFAKMEASRSGTRVDLTSGEFRILQFLVENAHRVVSREEILTQVFGYACSTHSRTMDNLILKLRQKLEEYPASPTHILTVHGVGYRFVR
jgi:DNA-binding response OmpR family regulator